MSRRPKSSKPTLAVAMIVRDEEHVLGRCLDSIVGIADQVVIVDTGSSDRTKEIALSYSDRFPGVGGSPGLRLLDFEWIHDFSAARNFGLDYVDADWALQLDADEEFCAGEGELADILRDRKVGAYMVRLGVAISADRWNEQAGVFGAYRLFRSADDIRFTSIIHENITVPDRWQKARCGVVLNHFGPTVDDRVGRPERNIELLRSRLESELESVYYRYLLAADLIVLERNDEAIAELRHCLAHGNARDPVLAMVHRDLALLLGQNGALKEALDVTREGQGLYPDYSDLVFLEGMMALSSGAYEVAASCFKRCLVMGDAPASRYWSWGGTGSTLAGIGLRGAQNGVNIFADPRVMSAGAAGGSSGEGFSRTGAALKTIAGLAENSGGVRGET